MYKVKIKQIALEELYYTFIGFSTLKIRYSFKLNTKNVNKI